MATARRRTPVFFSALVRRLRNVLGMTNRPSLQRETQIDHAMLGETRFFRPRKQTESGATRPSGLSTRWKTWREAFAADLTTQHELKSGAAGWIERHETRTRAYLGQDQVSQHGRDVRCVASNNHRGLWRAVSAVQKDQTHRQHKTRCGKPYEPPSRPRARLERPDRWHATASS